MAKSIRSERSAYVNELRARHLPWGQVAAALSERDGINRRVAMRLAHNWSQREAADEWNRRWPADPKTFKNFSYWEQWPAPSGYTPSLDVLARLAELYDCHVTDLLADYGDYRSGDAAFETTKQLSRLPDVLSAGYGAPKDAQASVSELVNRLDVIDVHGLAHQVASAVSRIDAKLNRRALVLKLSTALSLAAASPAFAQEPGNSVSPAATVEGDLSGIWHSRYTYYSTGQNKELEGQHFLVMRHEGDRLFGENTVAENASHLRLDLQLSGSVATGTWTERTAADGYYRGSVYHGAIQLVMDPMRKTMHGRWVGFDRDFNVDSNAWELSWKTNDTSKASRNKFEYRKP